MNNKKVLEDLVAVFKKAGFNLKEATEVDKEYCSNAIPCFGFTTKELGTFFISAEDFNFVINWSDVARFLAWKQDLPITFPHLFAGRPNNSTDSIQVDELSDVKYILLTIKNYIEEEFLKKEELARTKN